VHPDRRKYLLDLADTDYCKITVQLNFIFQEYMQANGASSLDDIKELATSCIPLIYNNFCFSGEVGGTTW
jgi:hypothetical protein|tara:strand:+ start:243 stop:452 length:210 start_codon:yes stop_codon:yes gene_type:complete